VLFPGTKLEMAVPSPPFLCPTPNKCCAGASLPCVKTDLASVYGYRSHRLLIVTFPAFFGPLLLFLPQLPLLRIEILWKSFILLPPKVTRNCFPDPLARDWFFYHGCKGFLFPFIHTLLFPYEDRFVGLDIFPSSCFLYCYTPLVDPFSFLPS